MSNLEKYITLSNEIKNDGNVTKEELLTFKNEIDNFIGENKEKEQLKALYEGLLKLNNSIEKQEKTTLNLNFERGGIDEMQINGHFGETRLFLDENLKIIEFITGKEEYKGTIDFKMGFTDRIYKIPYIIYIDENGNKILKIKHVLSNDIQTFILDDYNNKYLNIDFKYDYNNDNKNDNKKDNKKEKKIMAKHRLTLKFKINIK